LRSRIARESAACAGGSGGDRRREPTRTQSRLHMSAVRLGLRENAAQFALLVGLNALVGALVGLERSVLAPLGEHDFGIASKGAVLSFIVAFGAAKACANLAAGRLAQHGRKRVLVAGWALALPAPLLIGLAPNWAFVVVANLF